MSLVGPRPLILEESKHAAQTWHARRLDLRPGITGLWQVSGRSDLPFQEMVRFDYQYVAGWSLARDVEILLATIPVVLSGPRRLLSDCSLTAPRRPLAVRGLPAGRSRQGAGERKSSLPGGRASRRSGCSSSR